MSSPASPRCFLVLPAAGAGRRMRQAVPKQYLMLLGKPVLLHTLERIATHPAFHTTVVALAADDVAWETVATALPAALTARLRTVTGGQDRAASVRAALAALEGDAAPDDWVLVHDAVRPCLERPDLELLIDTLRNEPLGGILATPIRETVKRADAEGRIARTVQRDGLWLAATPQMFRYAVLCQALDAARDSGHEVTDEASAVEAWCAATGNTGTVRLVAGRATNIKVTWPEDLQLASLLLSDLPETRT